MNVKLKSNDLFTTFNQSFFQTNNVNRLKEFPIHNLKGIILGIEFLRLFNYTVFDYQNKQVKFYTDKNLFSINEQCFIFSNIIFRDYIIMLS